MEIPEPLKSPTKSFGTRHALEVLQTLLHEVYNPTVDDSPYQGTNKQYLKLQRSLRRWIEPRLTCLMTDKQSLEHFLSAPSGNLNWSFAIDCVRSELVRPLNGLRPKRSS
jgi:hypothetical protein